MRNPSKKFQKPYFKFETVFDISSFLWQNLQRAITKKIKWFFFNLPGNLLSIFWKLSKFVAPNCDGFWDIMFSMCKFAMANNSKKMIFFNFHLVIYFSQGP